MNEASKLQVDLSGAPQTMLATLYARALDADAEHPILGDRYAKDLVARIDFDWTNTGQNVKQAQSVTTRAARFDDWARKFLAAHDRAVVLHLGCGLDSRALRLQPGPGVEWYDVDYPDVIALRKQLYPSGEHYHLVPASVTDPAWLAAIPADRPALLLAEGLTMYLTEDDGVALLQRVVEHFPSGELQFDVFNWLGIKSQSRANVAVRRSGSTLHWAVNSPEDILGRVPGLRLQDTETMPNADLRGRVPFAYRRFGRKKTVAAALQSVAQLHRYAF
jgi:methyltransferase (TIGR00027 family)